MSWYRLFQHHLAEAENCIQAGIQHGDLSLVVLAGAQLACVMVKVVADHARAKEEQGGKTEQAAERTVVRAEPD